jgi:hypothetical protein
MSGGSAAHRRVSGVPAPAGQYVCRIVRLIYASRTFRSSGAGLRILELLQTSGSAGAAALLPRRRRRSRGEKYLGLGADGESETHRTAGGRAAGGRGNFFTRSNATRACRYPRPGLERPGYIQSAANAAGATGASPRTKSVEEFAAVPWPPEPPASLLSMGGGRLIILSTRGLSSLIEPGTSITIEVWEGFIPALGV